MRHFRRDFRRKPVQTSTDMGVNMAGKCIFDDEASSRSIKQEIIRRYYQALNRVAKEEGSKDEGLQDRAFDEAGQNFH